MSPKWFTWHHSRATHSILLSNSSFCLKLCAAHLAVSSFQKIGFTGGLKPSDRFWGNWALNGVCHYSGATHPIFTSKCSKFCAAHLPLYLKNMALLGPWNLVTTFGAIWLKMVYQILLWYNKLNLRKQPLILVKPLCCTLAASLLQKVGFTGARWPLLV